MVLLVFGSAIALVAAGMGLQRGLDDRQAVHRIGLAASTAQPTTRPAPSTVRAPQSARPPLAAVDARAARAIAIHIPRLKVDRSLVGLYVQSDGSLSVPASRHDVGWWRDGPRPGAAGATLLAGHVNLKSGPGVFANLNAMRVGDRVTVDRADRTSAVFQVVDKASYPRSNFPDDIVYREAGKSSIHLVTCDGAFNRATGLYEGNLVVFADLVSTRPTQKASR